MSQDYQTFHPNLGPSSNTWHRDIYAQTEGALLESGWESSELKI